MFRSRGTLRAALGALAVVAGFAGLARGQQVAPSSAAPRQADDPQMRPEVIMVRALRANPLTAPYAINVAWRDGIVILSGRVGTKLVHDAAVQMAIAFGFRFRDDLVIDTAETFRVAMSATPSMTGYGALAPNLSSSYYVYPQPLFGWLDDPFFGMQPPVVSFAPWWRSRRDVPMGGPNGAGPMPPSAAMPGGMGANPNPAAPMLGPMATNPNAAAAMPGAMATNPNAAAAMPGAIPSNPNPAAPVPGAFSWTPPNTAVPIQPGAPGAVGAMELPPPKGDIEITVDAQGQVFLRGVVASEQVAREIEQTAWSVPGVSRVVTQLHVKPRHANTPDQQEPPPPPQPVAMQPDRFMVPPRPDPAAAHPQPDRAPETPKPAVAPPAGFDQPPEPPTPGNVPRAEARPTPVTVAALDAQRLTKRVVDSLTRRQALGGQDIKVRTAGDAVTLSGKVASAYEAMLAYRAAQQTPGVREVVDRLEFLVPDEDHPNPLVHRGRPQDIEPYLTAQMSRHLGELAHIDTVRARGDHLEIRGTLLDAFDKERVLAILRSIPVLHGFELDTTLTAD
jgi:osmotically-inducible protein OsmY